MLLFIGQGDCSPLVCCRFNTSHVTLYQRKARTAAAKYAFQYITCYSLSWGQLAGMTCNGGFNTSHVTLYRHSAVYQSSPDSFQYITCYSLSQKEEAIQLWNVVFQYITCYSLSSTYLSASVILSSFNTSHVTLYPQQSHHY